MNRIALIALTLLLAGCDDRPDHPSPDAAVSLPDAGSTLPEGAIACTGSDRSADCSGASAEAVCAFLDFLICPAGYRPTLDTFANGCEACKAADTYFYLKRACTEDDSRACY